MMSNATEDKPAQHQRANATDSVRPAGGAIRPGLRATDLFVDWRGSIKARMIVFAQGWIQSGVL